MSKFHSNVVTEARIKKMPRYLPKPK